MVASYYANGKLDFEENEDFIDIGASVEIVVDLIKTKKVSEM